MTRITTYIKFALMVVLCHCFCQTKAAMAELPIQVQIGDEQIITQQHYRGMAIRGFEVPPAETNAPQLQGATMGTIGPQGGDATIISGVMTAGTVRVSNLANLEAALNLAAYGMTFLWIALGLYHLMKTIRRTNKTPDVVTLGLINTCSFIAIGVLTPGAINWGIAAARDAALFQ